MNELEEFLDTDEARGRMNYVETDAEGNVRRTSVPVQEAEEAERAMQDGASKRDIMARFVDESGTGYLPVTSRMREFHEKATAAGHRVAPVVTMVAKDDVVVDGSVLWKKGEERDVEAWSRDAEDDERTSARAKEQRGLMAKLVAQGFVPKATLEPDKTAMWNAFKDLGAEAWTDPTGEKGTGEYILDSLASGVATSAAKILGGAEKAIVGGVADVASLALRPFDGRKADRIQDIKRANAGIVDMATDFVVQNTAFDDMTKGVEGAKKALDTMGGVAEGVGGIVGMGAATKAIGAGVKATRAAQAIGRTAQEAGQIASKTALMLQMGAGGYENKRAELEQRAMEEGRTLTLEEKMRATAEGGKEALKSLLFGKLTGIGQKPMSQTNLAALEFGGMNAGDVVVDAFLDQTILRDGEAWNEAAKKMAWGFLEGGATSYLLSIGRAAGAASERIAKYREARNMERRQMVPETVRRAWTAWEVALKETQGMIDERNAQILADALRVKYPTDPTTGVPGVVGIGTNGTVQMEDGSVVRPPVPERTNERGEVVEPGRPGEMVTADGVVLDEKGGMKTVVPGKVGPLADGGYGVSIEVGVDPRTGLQKAPKETVRNAVVLLEEISDGSAKGEAVPVERIAEEMPSLKSANAGGVGEGSRGKPVVVLEEKNGNLVLVTGRRRLAEARETGAETIQAVRLRATDGWTRDTARMVDVIDNVRNGTLAEEKTLVAAYSALGLGRAEAEALGMLRTPAQRGAFTTVEKGGKTLIEAAANGVIGAEKAGAVAEALEAGRTGMDPSTMDRVEGELVPRVAGKAQRTVEQVAETLAEEMAKRGGKAPEGPELAKMVRAAIDEGERRARVERAERNGTTPEEEAKIESTPVETENGEIRTLEEVARKDESGKEPGKATERTWEVKVERGLQPTERPGEFRSAELPEVKATATEIEGPDGKAEEGVLLEGLTPEIVNGKRRTVLKILEEIIGSGKRVTTGDEATDRALAEIWDEAQGEREFARRTKSEIEPLAASAQRMADGVFGTGAVKVRAGTVEEMKAALQEKDGNGGKLLRDGTGAAYGFWDPNAKEVVLFPGASTRTVAHEVAWHAVREWAKENRPELARKMDAWAAEAPEDVKRWVEENYKDAKADELLDEFGAHRLEGERMKAFERILEKSPEAKKWYERLWEMVRECWRGITGRNDVAKMSPDEAVDWLVRQIEEGRKLKAEKGRRTPDTGSYKKLSISELYTGSAADYEKPDLHYVGTGEGNQVYGWGLYASNQRGVAEEYAKSDAKRRASTPDEMWPKYKGKFDSELEHDPVRAFALKYVAREGSVDAAIQFLRTDDWTERAAPKAREAAEWLEKNRDDVTPPQTPSENIYEQTFFTNRKPGDESHLLSWYEPVSKGQERHIEKILRDSGLDIEEKAKGELRKTQISKNGKLLLQFDNWSQVTGEDIYGLIKQALGSPKAASEWLAAHDIDGVKYPVDSYGKKVKDGDSAGWNYVSFRDDNIRVDHKWVDGQKRFSIRPSAQIDAEDGTELKVLEKAVKETVRRGSRAIGKQKHYRISKTSDIVREVLGGEYFTVSTKVINDHAGKDGDHVISAKDWNHISEALKDPLVIAKYSVRTRDGRRVYLPKSYHVWVETLINDHYAMVGVEVKSPAKNILVNSVTTIYGDEHVSVKQEDVVYSRNNEEGIRTLLGGPNPREYSEFPQRKESLSQDETAVKSATDNAGTFDRQNPDIRFSVRQVTPEEDAAYMDAVRRGDMEAARNLLKAAWERRGYSPDTSYKDAHAAPSAPVEAKDFKNVDALKEARDEGWDLNLWAIAKGITGQPDDFFDKRGPNLYGYDDAAGREAQRAVAQAIADIRGGNDKTRVIVYRAVPKGVKFDGLQSGGQWVSPSKTYVENHGKSRFGYGEYRIVRQVVRAENLWWDGNDAREWGYDDGRQYVYMNAENGMKLATVTYDDAGNVIPLSQRFDPQNPDVRLSHAEGEERLEGRKGTEAILIGGRRRVTRAGAGTEAGENGQRTAEYAERSDAGMTAGAELETTRWRDPHSPSATQYEGMALSTSELVKLYRDIQGTPGMPRVMMAESGKPWLGRVVRRNGKVQLDREMFGLVDESDRVAEKNDLKAAGGRGSFRHEDPTWALAHSAREVEAERNVSEMRLEGRLEGLAERRVEGTEAGGGRAERAVLAHEIGHLVCMMPDIRPAGTAKSMQTLGKLVIQKLEQAELTRVQRNRRFPGLNAEAVDFKRHALEAVKWWRGFEGEGNEGGHGTPGTRRFEEYFAKNDRELYAEVFGMFLAAPRALEQRAPDVYAAIRDSIAHNDTMIRAFNDLRAVRRGEGEHERVMREIEAQWTIEAQRDVDRLERDLDKPVHGRIGDWKLHVGLNMGSAEAPAVMVTSWQVKAKIAEAKRNWKRGLISKNDYETIRKDLLDELAEMKLAVLVKQRGGGQDRVYALDFLNKVIEQSTEEGVAVNDLRRYLQAQRVIEVQGRAMMAGIDARQARRILDDMKARLGNEGWIRVEAAAKRFQALREKNVLDNEWVREAFGDDLVNYWRSNAHYVTTRRTMSQEEAVRYRMARERWARLHPGETDVLGDIEALMQIHRSGSGASHGTTFLKPLQGSFRMNEDPLKATLENDLRIMMFARRNHFALTLADAAAKLRMPGFEEHADRGGVKWAIWGERYGTVGFMRDGERRVLVMPKAVAEGFKYAPSEVSGLIKWNRMLSAVLTQYNPAFALRNIFRNRASNENNIPWMQTGRVVTAGRLAGVGPIARIGEFLLERAMVRLPDRAARNALMNVLYGEKTNMYWIAEATRIAKLMYDPHGIREMAKRADQLAVEGKYGEAQRLLDDLARAKELMKHPIFAGTWRIMKGTTDRTDLDAVFRGLDLETNVDGTTLRGLGKVKAWLERKADTVKRFNSFEECRIKVIALLAAERAKMRAQAKGREFFSEEKLDYLTATMSGSPRYENRGRWMNVLEATFLGPFANVGMKGAQRTLESMKIDPGTWWRKASGRILGRIAFNTLWTAGGYTLVAAIARRIFSDDEEAQRKIDAFEDWGKRQSQALANVSDYRLRNYDIVPIGMFGRWCTFGLSLPRGDEDRMLMPFVDMATKAMLGTDTAKELGLGDPIDATYSWQEAIMNATVNSGLMPDIMRGSMFWNIGKDTLYAWMVGSPYNTFTQRTTYEQKMWDARWEDPIPAVTATAKQLFKDAGGSVFMPASTWDEDEGGVPEEGTWVMPVADGEKIPVKGSTIFQALHYVPFASSMLSGVFFVATDGDKRIQRRIDKLSKEEKTLRDQVAMRCLDRIMEIGAEANVDDILAEAKEKYQLDDVDWAIVNKALVGKVRKLAKETGNENEPILKIPSKVNEKTYRRLRRYLTNVGYEEEDE